MLLFYKETFTFVTKISICKGSPSLYQVKKAEFLETLFNAEGNDKSTYNLTFVYCAFLYLCGFVPFFGPFTAVLLAFPEQAEIDICVELAVESEASSICRLQPFFLFLVSWTVS